MKSGRRLLLACAVLLVAATGLLLALNHGKFASTFEGRLKHRVAITALDAARTLDGQMALGIQLSDTPALRGLLERSRKADPAIEALAILDQRGLTVLAVGAITPAIAAEVGKQGDPRSGSSVRQLARAAIITPLTNAFGVQTGSLVTEYQLDEASSNTRTAFQSLLRVAGLALVPALLILALYGYRASQARSTSNERTGSRLSLILTVLLLGIQGVIAFDTYRSFERVAAQDAPSLAFALAGTLEPTLQRALDSGIPIEELRDAQAWLSSALEAGPEFGSLTLLSPTGAELAHSIKLNHAVTIDRLRQIDHPVLNQGIQIASLRVGLDPEALSERTRQLAIEFLVLILAGGLLIHEIVAAMTSRTQRTEPGQLADLRLPLFLYFLGSELPRSFLPVWSKDLASRAAQAQPTHASAIDTLVAPLFALPESLLVSLPISVFLFAVALSSPWSGSFCARFGSQRLMLVGLTFALIGHLLAAFAESLPVLIVARILAGISFGCVSLAALDFISSQSAGRATGMAMYLAAYVSAGIAGSGLGSLIYDRAGTGMVFSFGIACSAIAMVALTRLQSIGGRQGNSAPLRSSIGILLRTPGFVKLIALASMPLQILQQGLLFYWVPLAVLAIGEKTSFTGLAMMVYFAMVLVFNKPLARFADKSKRYSLLLGIGLAIAGIAGILGTAAVFKDSDGLTAFGASGILVGVTLIGLAWALAFPSQGAMAILVSRNELPGIDPAVTLGLFRTIERVVAMLTPIVVATLIAAFGLWQAAIAIAVLLLLCSVAQTYFLRRVNP